jgi:hypothetical protein
MGPVALVLAAAFTISSATAATIQSDLSDFVAIELNSSADVEITIGSEYSITMTGAQESIDRMELDIKGNTLEIRDRGKFKLFGRGSLGEVQIAITMPDIEEMKIRSSGNAEITGVDNDNIKFDIDSSGDIYVTGKSENLNIEINSSGDIELDEFTANTVFIEVNSSGDVEFDGGQCNNMQIEVDSSGDVDAREFVCKEVSVDVSSSGDSRVYASELVTVEANSSGKIDVFGEPKKVVDNTRRKSKIRIR